MKLFKQKVAGFIIRNNFKKNRFKNQSFSSAFVNANSFLVLMPEDEDDFQYAVGIIDYLEKNKKDFFILTFDYRVSILPYKYRGKAIAHGIKDVNKIDLPSKKLISNLKKKNFDAILDLNRKEHLFYIYISCAMSASVSIGFTKNLADEIYNLQIANSETKAKISYENLLSCLKML
jgi:hypothetical protein